MQPVKARLIKTDDKVAVQFDEPAMGVAAGQALVVYGLVDDGGDASADETILSGNGKNGEKKNWQVLGGGFITRDHLQPFLPQ